MSSDKAPEKVVYVKGNFSNENYFCGDPLHHSGETVLATYIREDLVQKAKRDAAEYVLSNGTDNFIRRREMFEKVYLSCLSNMANDQLSDAVFNNKVEAQTEELLKRADKFAWGEE